MDYHTILLGKEGGLRFGELLQGVILASEGLNFGHHHSQR